MSSVWIILGSQTQVLFRLHLPLLFVSMLHPLLTFWRAACLCIRPNTPEFWIQKTYQPSCPSHVHVCEDALAKYVWMFMLNRVRFYFDSIDLDNKKMWRFLSLTPGTESTGTLYKTLNGPLWPFWLVYLWHYVMFMESDPDNVILDSNIIVEVSHGTLLVVKLNHDVINIQSSLKTRILNLRKIIYILWMAYTFFFSHILEKWVSGF